MIVLRPACGVLIPAKQRFAPEPERSGKSCVTFFVIVRRPGLLVSQGVALCKTAGRRPCLSPNPQSRLQHEVDACASARRLTPAVLCSVAYTPFTISVSSDSSHFTIYIPHQTAEAVCFISSLSILYTAQPHKSLQRIQTLPSPPVNSSWCKRHQPLPVPTTTQALPGIWLVGPRRLSCAHRTRFSLLLSGCEPAGR